MFARKRVTPTKRRRHRSRRYYGLTIKDGLKFLSALILPLMLGIFTVVITFQQQKMAQEQRLEDKNDERLRREQDWNIAQSAQATQSNARLDQYRDEVLIAYIKETGDFLRAHNGSLTSDPLIHTLAHVKTLNVFRQLDG